MVRTWTSQAELRRQLLPVHPRTHDLEGNPSPQERARPVLVESATACSMGAHPLLAPHDLPVPRVARLARPFRTRNRAAKLVNAVEAVCRAHGVANYVPEFRLWRAGQNNEHFAETIAARPSLAQVVCAPPITQAGCAEPLVSLHAPPSGTRIGGRRSTSLG